jgi:hypothetical protein
MRAFVMMLSVVCWLPSVGLHAEDGKGGADFVQPILNRVAKMGTAEQQAWLARLEQRAANAARLTLNPDEAARQQAQIATMLHQKLVTWPLLQQVIEETSRRERDAIDMLAERYRSRILRTFANQPELRDNRQAAWATVYQDWKTAGGRFDEQDRLIDWLEAAIRDAKVEQIVAMPEKPETILPALTPGPSPIKGEGSSVAPLTPGPSPATGEGSSVALTPGPSPIKGEGSRTALTPGPSPATGEGSRTREVAVKTHSTVRPAAQKSADAMQVNLDELAARIAGNNLGFRTLESELDEKGPWTAATLEPLAERLKVLVMRHNDLVLFRQLTPEENRSSLGRLETPKSAISQFGARIFEARKLASGADFQGTDAERHAELERLDTLSRELAELAQK